MREVLPNLVTFLYTSRMISEARFAAGAAMLVPAHVILLSTRSEFCETDEKESFGRRAAGLLLWRLERAEPSELREEDGGQTDGQQSAEAAGDDAPGRAEHVGAGLIVS